MTQLVAAAAAAATACLVEMLTII